MTFAKPDYLSSVWKDSIFAGKVVFCTGGNGTICSAQVSALVHLGANACIVGRDIQKTKTAADSIAAARPGSRVLGIGAIDVRNPESLQNAVNECVQELGGIDFLIAGAAGNFLASAANLSTKAFRTVIEIDLIGSYNATKVCLPHLLASVRKHNKQGGLPTSSDLGPGGRIIYVSATLHYTGVTLQTHASAAKAGVDALSNNIAIEYGPLGITSNVIAPGPIANTEGLNRLVVQPKGDQVQGRSIPLARWGLVKDIADATIWLFSDAANYVTAQTTVVDGGAWRTQTSTTSNIPYPETILCQKELSNIKRQEKYGKL